MKKKQIIKILQCIPTFNVYWGTMIDDPDQEYRQIWSVSLTSPSVKFCGSPSLEELLEEVWKYLKDEKVF